MNHVRRRYVCTCILGMYVSALVVWWEWPSPWVVVFAALGLLNLYCLVIELTPDGIYQIGPWTFWVGPRDDEKGDEE